MTERVSRRRFVAMAGGLCAAACGSLVARAQTTPTINVKTLGAFGDGKLSDLPQVREAVRMASKHPRGATIYFPPGEYYLGAVDDAYLVMAENIQNVRIVGERATLTCRSVAGSSSMLVLVGSRNVTVEGLTFRDHGVRREAGIGAAAIRLLNDGVAGCQDTHIKDCTFDSVMTGIVCRHFDDGDKARTRGVNLTNVSVSRAYYGFNFQDAGDEVVGRALTCNDVRRSYFPYGVTKHDIELDTRNNASGFTDVLIKCYHKDTSALRVKVKCRGKRSGDAIVALDHQHENGRGTISDVSLDLDIDDADCRLSTAILIRSLAPNGKQERETFNRWDNIVIDGDVRICERTKLIEIGTVGKSPGRLHIGSRLSKNPRLPSSLPGFNVSRA